METIKDMVTLRAFAVEQAVKHTDNRVRGGYKDLAVSDMIARAKVIEAYILGGTKLPENGSLTTLGGDLDQYMRNLLNEYANNE